MNPLDRVEPGETEVPAGRLILGALERSWLVSQSEIIDRYLCRGVAKSVGRQVKQVVKCVVKSQADTILLAIITTRMESASELDVKANESRLEIEQVRYLRLRRHVDRSSTGSGDRRGARGPAIIVESRWTVTS